MSDHITIGYIDNINDLKQYKQRQKLLLSHAFHFDV